LNRRFTLSALAVWGLSSVAVLLGAGGIATGQSRGEVLHVAVDVKPGDTPKTIEPKRGGMIPIAILTTREFDSSRVDPATVTVGATGAEAAVFRSMSEDVDRDGDTDMLLLIRVQDMKLECSDAAVRLRGKTLEGQEIEGGQAVKMEGCA
jgi:hypothetical protein